MGEGEVKGLQVLPHWLPVQSQVRDGWHLTALELPGPEFPLPRLGMESAAA